VSVDVMALDEHDDLVMMNINPDKNYQPKK
jgi:hypothetical protein